MIALMLLLGASLSGGGSNYKFYNSFIQLVERTHKKIERIIGGKVLGVSFSLKKTNNGYIQYITYYNEKYSSIYETVISNTISESIVPSEIGKKMHIGETKSFTSEIGQRLSKPYSPNAEFEIGMKSFFNNLFS